MAATFASSALAEPSGQQKRVAQALFDKARALMNAGNVSEACARFAESHKLDPAAGTLLNLGLCHEKEGRLASAYTELNESLSRALKDGRADRERTARDHLALVGPRVSHLSVNVARVPGLAVEVTLDGAALAEAAWGFAIPVDPGEHVIEATVAGKPPWTGRVTVGADADARSIDVPPLGTAPPATSSAAPPATTAPPPASASASSSATALPPMPEPPARETSSQRTIGLVVGAVGLGGLGAGAIFGVLAQGKWSDAKSACPGTTCGNSADLALGRDAGRLADVATIAFVAGGAALGVGALLFFTAPRTAAPRATGALRITPLVGPDRVGLSVGGPL